MLGKAATGESLMSVVSKRTLAQVAKPHLDLLRSQVKTGDRSPRTLALAEYLWRDYLDPKLGNRRVRTITTQNVRELMSELRGAGLSGATVSKIVALLGAMLHLAVESGDLASNPVSSLKPGERKTEPVRVRRALTDEELARLVEHAGSGQTKRLIAFLAGSGLRLSEALGLYPDEVRDGRVHVTEQLERSGERRIKTKTPLAVRVLKLSPDATVAAKEQEAWRLSVGARASRWLWTTPTGRPLDQANVQKAVRSAGEMAGLGLVSPHELRYTHASRLHELGVPLADAAAELGHSLASHAAQTAHYTQSRGDYTERHERIRAKVG
jgi:integrase